MTKGLKKSLNLKQQYLTKKMRVPLYIERGINSEMPWNSYEHFTQVGIGK